MSKHNGIGLTDKLYWRFLKPGMEEGDRAHCFKKLHIEGINAIGYETICSKWWRSCSGGQSCARPMLSKRCLDCNRLEMKRRDWDEPGPVS